VEELIGKRPFEEKKILEVEEESTVATETTPVAQAPSESPASDDNISTDSTVIA